MVSGGGVFFPEGVEGSEDVVSSEDVDVIVTCVSDVKELFWAGMELVEFFAVPLGDDLVVIAVDDKEGCVD